MDIKDQIVSCVRQIDRLNTQKADLWTKVRKCIADHRVDDAITLLNRYFSVKEKLEGVETSLAGMLKGQFSDK